MYANPREPPGGEGGVWGDAPRFEKVALPCGSCLGARRFWDGPVWPSVFFDKAGIRFSWLIGGDAMHKTLMQRAAVVSAVQDNHSVVGTRGCEYAHPPLRGSATGLSGFLACKRDWADRLEAECAAAESCEHWRFRDGVVQVGYERVGCVSVDGRSFSTYIAWRDVPFLSSFLLRRRFDLLAAEADGVPF